MIEIAVAFLVWLAWDAFDEWLYQRRRVGWDPYVDRLRTLEAEPPATGFWTPTKGGGR